MSEVDAGNPAAPGAIDPVERKRQEVVEFLLRRMRHQSDFPVLSQSLAEINRVVASEDEDVDAVANVILKNFSLTNKLLRLVNAAFFSQFGGTISTVSRAVVILGFDALRNVAATLLLLEHLDNNAQAGQLKDEITAAYLSGLVARALVPKASVRDAEEAFIYAMFHRLGRLLVIFYLHDEAQAIERRIKVQGEEERGAALAVLGLPYEELGMAVARTWNFPAALVSSMEPLPDGLVSAPRTEAGRLRAVACLANAVCAQANEAGEVEHDALEALATRFKDIGVDEAALRTTLSTALDALAVEGPMLGLSLRGSELVRRARAITRAEPEAAGVSAATQEDALAEVRLDSSPRLDSHGAEPEAAPTPEVVLSAGVGDIIETLVGEYDVNAVLRMVLETMYRGLRFDRVLLCVHERASGNVVARFGFGEDIQGVLANFRFPSRFAPDVFHLALDKQQDIFIADADAPKIAERIPAWYRRAVPAKTFLLLPVVVDKRVIGFFYGDRDFPGSLEIAAKELALLKTLRNQAVLALRSRGR